MDKVIVYQNVVGEWHWHREDENGKVVSLSENGYVEKKYAIQAATLTNLDVVEIVVVE